MVGTALVRVLSVQNEIVEFRGDVRDAAAIERALIKEESIDAVIHLAAIVPKQIVDLDPKAAFDVNVGGTLNILEALRKRQSLGLPVPWSFLASTSHVYASSKQPLSEDSLRRPFTLYGLTKLQAEEWFEVYARDHGFRVSIGRFFSFSAPTQSHHYFIPAMVRRIDQAAKGEKLVVSGVNGTRDFMRVSQVCSGVSFLFDRKATGVFNVSTGRPVPLLDVIRRLARLMGRNDLEISGKDDAPNFLSSDSSKLKALGLVLEDETDQLLGEMANATSAK